MSEIKQILDAFFHALDTKYTIEETDHSSFIKGRVGRVSVKNKKLAYIGEISPEVLKNWELTMPVTSLEINLSELFEFIK